MLRILILGACPLLGIATVLFLASRLRPASTSLAIDDSRKLAPILEMQFPEAPKPLQKKIEILILQLKELPEDNKTLATLGMTLMAHELKSFAVPCFELLELREPEEFRWPYLLGHSLMFVAPEVAITKFRRASELQTDNVPAQMMLTEVLLANGLTAEAKHQLENDIPESVKRHPWKAWQESRLEFMLGDFNKSEELLEGLRKQGIVSRSLLRQLMMVKRRTRGAADQKMLQQELASCSQELLVWDCRVIREVQSEKLDTQVVIANAQLCMARRDLQGAINIFRKAMEVDPGSPDLMFNLAYLWQQAGELQRADEVLKTAQTFEQGSLRITLLRARIAIIQQDWPNAKDLCEQSLAIKPDSSEVWYVTAVMQNQQKRFDEARISVQRALKLDPLNPDATRLGQELKSR